MRVQAFGLPEILFPSNVANNEVLVFNPISGYLEKKSVVNNSAQRLSQISPTGISLYRQSERSRSSEIAILEVISSPDQSKVLVKATNESFQDSFSNYPFYNQSNASEELWWIYDTELEEVIELSSNFDLVSWYSNEQIIYTFDNREVSIATVSNLDSFETLSTLPQPVDSDKMIVGNSTNQIIPLERGYLVGSNGEYTFLETLGEAFALPEQDSFVIVLGRNIERYDWRGNLIEVLETPLSIYQALYNGDDTYSVLHESGDLVIYNSEEDRSNQVSTSQIRNIRYANKDNASEILLISDSTVEIILARIDRLEELTSLSSPEITTNQVSDDISDSFSTRLLILVVSSILLVIFGLFWRRKTQRQKR